MADANLCKFSVFYERDKIKLKEEKIKNRKPKSQKPKPNYKNGNSLFNLDRAERKITVC